MENIFELDQSVRDGKKEAELIRDYGYNSKEHMDYINEQWRQDEINLIKIEAYLQKHGYPEKEICPLAVKKDN